MERYIPEVRQGFTDNKGKFYPNIREIAYEQGKTYGSFGQLIGESGKEIFGSEEELDGVYVFRSYIDPTKAYRIYKDFVYPKFNNTEDVPFMSSLLEQGKNVKLSEFPTGVITEGGRVIGQEIPFVEGITIKEYSLNNKNKIVPTRLYIQMLDILNELYSNKIYYLDIHERNFMINQDVIKIIDFDKTFVKFEHLSLSNKRLMFDYLRSMFDELNKNFGIEDEFGFIDGMDDAYEKVLRLEQKLINQGYNK